MGASQSRQPDLNIPLVSNEVYQKTPPFMAPDNVVTKIRGLGEVVGHFNNNDTSSLEEFIDTYNKQVSQKEKIELGPEIKQMMMTFHNQLLEVIDTQLVGASKEDKQQVLKAKIKDNKQLNEMLKLYYDQKLRDIELRVMNDEAVKGNKDIFSTVRTILNNVKSLKVKYKFFEYKYIQLNVFMIIFIQYVYNSMTKFIVDVIAYNQARDSIRQEMTNKIFKAMQDIMGSADINLKPEDANAINKMIFNLQEKIKKDQVEIQDLSGRLKNNSMGDLLNFVLSSDENLASHIMQGVDKYKQNKQFKQNMNPNLQYNQNQYNQNQNNYLKPPFIPNQQNQNQAINPTQFGGFMRDFSLLPQAFYELNGPTSS